MFQPNPAPVITKIIRSRVVPVWLLAAVVATQIAINAGSKSEDPNCRIEVQSVHQSRHSQRFLNESDAKVKISTQCNVSQVKTSLTVDFQEEISAEKFEVVKTLRSIVVAPNPKTPNQVFIKNITTPCNLQGSAQYRAHAYGQVHLADGRVESVSGISQNSNTLECRISAK